MLAFKGLQGTAWSHGRECVHFGFLVCRLGRGTRFALEFCGICCEVPHKWILRIHPEGQVLISSIWEVKADDLKGGIERKMRPNVIDILPRIPLTPGLSKLSRNSPLPVPQYLVRETAGHLLGAGRGLHTCLYTPHYPSLAEPHTPPGAAPLQGWGRGGG